MDADRLISGVGRGAGEGAGVSGCPFHAGGPLPASDGVDEFAAFFEEAVAEGISTGPVSDRVAAEKARVAAGQPVALSTAELALAGRLAWRNQARCIGRLFWRSLLVRDARGVGDSVGMYTALCEHLAATTRQGEIRPVMTVFAPARPGRCGPIIRNRQLLGYAGYEEGGRVLGDPINRALTREALALGWQPPRERTAFDLLPWILVGEDERPALFPLPRELVMEVPLTHPTLPWFAELGLRWYAVPVVCDQRLRVMETDFTAAPFGGWYMGTEIGCRNLADEQRYNVLPAVADRLGLDRSRRDSLWRERALVELNAAVLHSYAAAGCRLVDHHTASDEFMRFCAMEKAAGREVSAAWDWIVPPLAGAATKVFHLPMQDRKLRPQFLPGEGRD